MSLPVTFANVVEIFTITGSLVLGILVLASYRHERSGRLFGLLCLVLALWKCLDFASPDLTASPLVQSLSWAAAAISVALAWHFVVAYTGQGRRELRRMWSALYFTSLPLAVIALLGSLRNNIVFQGVFAVNFVLGMGGITALSFYSYLRERRREMVCAILGTLSIALGAGVHIITILFNLGDWRFHTYGMLAFEAFFAYDILVAGLLRERKERVTTLEELGLRERRLEMAEESFRRLLDASYDILFTMDREGNIVAISTEAEEIQGIKVKDLLGKGYLDYVSEKDRTRIADAVLKGMQGDKIRDMEVEIAIPDGPRAVFLITATRIRGEDGMALVIARDITASKLMELELEERNRLLEEANRRLRELDALKTELVGIVGHELRSPLTVIYSYGAALEDHWEMMSEERKLECVDHILKECNRLNRMVENILDMSRIESERLFMHYQEADLVVFLRDTAREMSMTPGARPVNVVTSMGSLELQADWDKMKQVLINLLDNAFRFSPPGAQVLLTGDLEDSSIVVRVKDGGPGIPRENRDCLFDKFTQSKASGMERGLGLGLYIVRTFVEAHGGKVWLEEEEGFGTVIAFSLPLEVKKA